MDESGKFTLSERVAPAAALIGLFGTLVAMALPLAYPDLPPVIYRGIFWFSFISLVIAIAYLVWDRLRSYGLTKVLAIIIFFSCAIILMWALSDQPTYLRALIGAAFGAILMAGGPWIYSWVHSHMMIDHRKTVAVSDQNPPAPKRPGPTLEANTGGIINAEGAVIPGDLPFQFGRAETGGVIHMPGIQVTRKEDGSMTIGPSANPPPPLAFPEPPDNRFHRASDAELKQRARVIAAELRQFQERFTVAFRELPRLPLPKGGVDDEVFRAFSKKWKAEYEQNHINEAYVLACEYLNRGHQLRATRGATTLFYKSFAGPSAALEVADFLDAIAADQSRSATQE